MHSVEIFVYSLYNTIKSYVMKTYVVNHRLLALSCLISTVSLRTLCYIEEAVYLV